MTLSAFGYGSALEPVGSALPRASANRVSYAHGALTEWYANGPLGIEQGFDVAARPTAAAGPLTLSLALSGNLAAHLRNGSVLLTGRGTTLRYGNLYATDARGRVLRSWLQPVNGHVLIRVADRGASYPLHIDPLIRAGRKAHRHGRDRGRPVRLQRGALRRRQHRADRRALRERRRRGGVGVHPFGLDLDPAGRKARRHGPCRRRRIRPHLRRRIRRRASRFPATATRR